MNTLKKLYREYFGLREQTTPSSQQGSVTMPKETPPDKLKQLTGQGLNVKLENNDIDEARLINNITDYRGGVEYVLRDPAEAQSVANEIKEWSQKKGFTIIKHTISSSGKVGYFYFRLGEDPARESQRIQGYIAQKPEIKHFRFNVRAAKPNPQQPNI